MSYNTLPAPSANQAFCDVSALEAGLMELPDEMFITNATPGKVTTAPSLAFLLNHSTHNQRFIFDLGIRKDLENYPPRTAQRIKTTFHVQVQQDVAESLEKGGTSPSDITYVCLSHSHWDHTGNTHLFPNTTFLVGSACKILFNPGYPQDPNGRFASDLLPEGRTRFLDTSEWEPIGPFPRALDTTVTAVSISSMHQVISQVTLTFLHARLLMVLGSTLLEIVPTTRIF